MNTKLMKVFVAFVALDPNVSVISQANGVWHENSCVDFSNPVNYWSGN